MGKRVTTIHASTRSSSGPSSSRANTKRPLAGLTDDIAEYEAASLVDALLVGNRNPGFDAIAPDGRRIQIRGRCVARPYKDSEFIGRIEMRQQFDAVLLVLLDKNFGIYNMFEASRGDFSQALQMTPHSRDTPRVPLQASIATASTPQGKRLLRPPIRRRSVLGAGARTLRQSGGSWPSLVGRLRIR
jgi:hypothetical protein